MAQEDRNGVGVTSGVPSPGPRPNGCPNLNFDFPLNLASSTTATFTDASVTNLFYLVKHAHDISYRYGFDEASGNFQSLNYGQAGRGAIWYWRLGQSDGNALVPINNAFMATPPDGFQPLMVMGEFNVDFTSPAGALYQPRRDTSLLSDVVLHEFFHGVSNRLTGGPANAGALNAQQSASMEKDGAISSPSGLCKGRPTYRPLPLNRVSISPGLPQRFLERAFVDFHTALICPSIRCCSAISIMAVVPMRWRLQLRSPQCGRDLGLDAVGFELDPAGRNTASIPISSPARGIIWQCGW